MASVNLFGRAFNLVIGIPPANGPKGSVDIAETVMSAAYQDGAQGLDISGFDCHFDVFRTLKAQPPRCDVRIWNLSKDSQKAIQGRPFLVVQLQAGFQNALTTLYLGTVSSVWTERKEADMITHLESGHGGVQFATGRIHSKTALTGAKVPLSAAINTIVAALGINQGNLPSIVPALLAKGIKTVPGGMLAGSAARCLTDLLLSVGYQWSIQNGAIQVMANNTVLNPQVAIVCSESTGMVGSPSVDSKGVVHAKMLIVPGLVPGVLVDFRTEFLTGTYSVQQVKYVGETAGDAWFCEFKCLPYKT